MDEWGERLQESLSPWLAGGAHQITELPDEPSNSDDWDVSESLGAATKALQDVASEMRSELEAKSGILAEESAAEVRTAVQLALRRLVVKEKRASASVLLDIAIQLALEAEFATPELPFLLLEDLFEVETVERFSDLWTLLDRRAAILTGPEFMPSKGPTTLSKMAMLRIANFVLRRLSALRHTVLCGRVMMFLAFAFPLSDRSGVNLLGAYNELNVTDFEDSESFKAAQLATAAATGPMQGNDAQDTQVVNFSLYETFWELQRFFMSKPNVAPSGCVSSVKRWERFLEVSRVVLAAFEAKPFSKADLEREMVKSRHKKRRRLSIEPMDTSDANGDVPIEPSKFFPTKYLSSSRLLKLQLSDPTLRRNVLVQFCILIQALNSATYLKLEPLVKLRVDDPATGVKSLEQRIAKLLSATPPDGETFLADLDHILAREAKWMNWKSSKCPPFERTEEAVEPDAEQQKTQMEARNRAKASMHSRMSTKIRQNRELWKPQLKEWQEELSQDSKNAIPKFSEFMRDMEIAIDPENCIEDEYHPKHDPVYCWRGLRLLSRHSVGIMKQVTDGSLENACLKMLNKSPTVNKDATRSTKSDPMDVGAEPDQTEVKELEDEEEKTTEAEAGHQSDTEAHAVASQGADSQHIDPELSPVQSEAEPSGTYSSPSPNGGDPVATPNEDAAPSPSSPISNAADVVPDSPGIDDEGTQDSSTAAGLNHVPHPNAENSVDADIDMVDSAAPSPDGDSTTK